MATRTKFVPGFPETHCLDGTTWGHMEDDYAPDDDDREWVARELGDVPHDRIVGLNCHDNPMEWVGAKLQYQDRPWEPWKDVPVESMERERNAYLIAIGQQSACHNVNWYQQKLDELKAQGPVEWVPK